MYEPTVKALLFIMPWSFVAKTLALGLMWWSLSSRTIPTGPLGVRINASFRDQFIMSAVITWAMAILSVQVDPGDIDWPFVTIALLLLVVWPIRAAWGHYRVLTTYRSIARERGEA